MATAKKRPTGLTAIAILVIIGGVFLWLSGLYFLALAEILPMWGAMPTEAVGAMWIFTIAGPISMIFGILYFIMSYGLLKGKGWAWTGTIISLIIGTLICNIPTMANPSVYGLSSIIPSVIIAIIIIGYLTRPHVKEFFGKGVKTP